MHEHTQLLWLDIFTLAIIKPEAFPSDFAEARLVLIPKAEGAIAPKNTRPISITNSCYRLVMKCHADSIRANLSPHLSTAQRALLEDRFINDCIDDVNNTLHQYYYKSKPIFLLKTDFEKAYDFIN